MRYGAEGCKMNMISLIKSSLLRERYEVISKFPEPHSTNAPYLDHRLNLIYQAAGCWHKMSNFVGLWLRCVFRLVQRSNAPGKQRSEQNRKIIISACSQYGGKPQESMWICFRSADFASSVRTCRNGFLHLLLFYLTSKKLDTHQLRWEVPTHLNKFGTVCGGGFLYIGQPKKIPQLSRPHQDRSGKIIHKIPRVCLIMALLWVTKTGNSSKWLKISINRKFVLKSYRREESSVTLTLERRTCLIRDEANLSDIHHVAMRLCSQSHGFCSQSSMPNWTRSAFWYEISIKGDIAICAPVIINLD